jgi:hypothetical protein
MRFILTMLNMNFIMIMLMMMMNQNNTLINGLCQIQI